MTRPPHARCLYGSCGESVTHTIVEGEVWGFRFCKRHAITIARTDKYGVPIIPLQPHEKRSDYDPLADYTSPDPQPGPGATHAHDPAKPAPAGGGAAPDRNGD